MGEHRGTGYVRGSSFQPPGISGELPGRVPSGSLDTVRVAKRRTSWPPAPGHRIQLEMKLLVKSDGLIHMRFLS